jgi:hypothetical protein
MNKQEVESIARDMVTAMLGYPPGTDPGAIATDMARVRVQTLSALRAAALILVGTKESHKEARQIQDFYKWGQ